MGTPESLAYAEGYVKYQEQVARERYPETIRQSNGLFRALMQVMCTDADRKEAMRRFKADPQFPDLEARLLESNAARKKAGQ